MKLLAPIALALALSSCAVTDTKIKEAVSQSPMKNDLADWEIQRGRDYVEMVPRGHAVDSGGDWIYSGDVNVRWWIPPIDSVGETQREEFQKVATEGAVSLQVASARWVTKENAQYYLGELYDGTLIGTGMILRAVAENSTDMLYKTN